MKKWREQEIIERTLRGEKQKDIAAAMRLSTDTIRKHQAAANLRPNQSFTATPEQKKEVFRLFAEGHGSPYISTQLNLPGHVAARVMRELGLRRTAGEQYARYDFPVEKLRCIRRAIRESERRIAKEFGVSHSWLRRFRHTMWSNTGDQHPRRRKLAAQPDPVGIFFEKAKLERITAQEFVSTYFQFSPRLGVNITGADVKRGAEICMKLRTEFCGTPPNPDEYRRELCAAIAARLGVEQPTAWVH